VFRKLFQVAFIFGSLAGMASCGATDEGSQSPSASSSFSATRGWSEDGGAVEDAGPPAAGRFDARGRTLLIEGGDVTFLGVDRRHRRCHDRDGDAGEGCNAQEQFFGAVIVRGAQFSILLGPADGDGGVTTPPGGDDGGVTRAPGGDDGGVAPPGGEDGGIASSSGNAFLRVDGAVLSFASPSDGDAGVGVPPNADGGTSGSVELSGGRMVVVLARATVDENDGGVAAEDGGVDRGRRGVRELRNIRTVLVQGAVIHLRGGDADGGAP
jgi:hypothetical protein